MVSESGAGAGVVPVFFLSDSTGISAETMGNALLLQFPDLVFERTTIPFITTLERAREVVAMLDAAMDGPVAPLAFTTAAEDAIRAESERLFPHTRPGRSGSYNGVGWAAGRAAADQATFTAGRLSA